MGNKCRACLTSVSNVKYYSLLTVFPEFKKKSLTVLDLLCTVTSSQVDLDENLPSKICDPCFRTLKHAYGFIVAFKFSQNVLSKKNTINQIKTLPNISNKQDHEIQENTLDLMEEKIIIITGGEDPQDSLDQGEDDEESNDSKPLKIDSLLTDSNVSDITSDDGLSEYKEEVKSEDDLSQEEDEIMENDFNQEDMLKDDQIKEELDNTMLEQLETEDAISDDNSNQDMNKRKLTVKRNSVNLNKKEPQKCEICNKEYYLVSNLLKHMNSKHSNQTEQVEDGNELYKCETCDKLFKSKKQFKLHEYNFHHPDSDEKYRCKICNELFTNSAAVRYHTAAKHVGKKYSCSICHKQFMSPSGVKVHIMEVHENNKPEKFLCSVCGRGFKYSSALKYHVAYEHTKQKDFVCGFCGLSFVLQGALRNHERTHTDERPYKCKYCEKSFKRSPERKRHQNTHLGIYPHHCKYCGKEFTSKYNMRVHWLQHHGNFRCEVCVKGFASAEILKFHCWTRHKKADVKIETE